jgi:hypothetical protein
VSASPYPGACSDTEAWPIRLTSARSGSNSPVAPLEGGSVEGRCEDLVARERATHSPNHCTETAEAAPNRPGPASIAARNCVWHARTLTDRKRAWRGHHPLAILRKSRRLRGMGPTSAAPHARFPAEWISPLPCGRNARLATCRWGFRRHQQARRLDPEAPKWGAFEAIALDEATSRAARSPREVQCWASAASQRVRAPHPRARRSGESESEAKLPPRLVLVSPHVHLRPWPG